MDLVRLILLELEAFTPLFNGYHSIRVSDLQCIDEYSHDVVAGHMQMMHASGLYASYNNRSNWRQFIGLTWQGHDFLDSIRDPEIWKLTKDGADQAGGFTVEILGALATGFIKKQIEKQTGVEL